MTNLKTLKFVAMPKLGNDPVVNRRQKLISRLEDQKALAQDPSYLRTVQKWVKKDGERSLVETKKKVRPWWRVDANGSVIFVVKQGWKLIEFETGKAGIAVPSQDKLVSVIDTVIAATKQGELDVSLSKGSTAKPAGKRKAAA